eukprot:CAMPEP_0181300164 /NCGR_PEP_ID=MMETSP1101-20121128/6742_1 /TAXON_ID=46948 /ORGANISM="Rhodomonas abbreviata, Strain Caron Lab Isolate" /LENGTH=590 /DNA_ID=CAMNT_0023405379 /DNA_START=102 /DNA_END=1874 /DNA_ORIENTATION=-
MPRLGGLFKSFLHTRKSHDGEKGDVHRVMSSDFGDSDRRRSDCTGEMRTKSTPGNLTETQKMIQRKRASAGVETSITLPKVQRKEFEVSKKLGEGSFGQVLLAKWTTTGETVALKVLKEEESFGNQLAECGVLYEDVLSCFEQEIAIMEFCGAHPNIIGVHGKGYDGRVLVMDQAKTDIYRVVKKSGATLPLRNILRWGKDILSAITHIHDCGVIHQDVKSSNILIAEDGTAKICDFGLAMKGRGRFIADRELLTLWYRAPELLMGSRVYSNKVDEWGVGTILLEMLLGRVPFTGDPKTRCQCFQISHVNFNADQLSKIFQTMGTPAEEDVSNMACRGHFLHWPKHKPRLDEHIRKALAKRLSVDAIEDQEPDEEEVMRWTEVIGGLLNVIPERRDTCEEALRSRLFAAEAAHVSACSTTVASPSSVRAMSPPASGTMPALATVKDLPPLASTDAIRPAPSSSSSSTSSSSAGFGRAKSEAAGRAEVVQGQKKVFLGKAPRSPSMESVLSSGATEEEDSMHSTGSASHHKGEHPERRKTTMSRWLHGGFSYFARSGVKRTPSQADADECPIPVLEIGERNCVDVQAVSNN